MSSESTSTGSTSSTSNTSGPSSTSTGLTSCLLFVNIVSCVRYKCLMCFNSMHQCCFMCFYLLVAFVLTRVVTSFYYFI